ncbi:MAG: vWA domain-containing protein, partial [Isosphaeraceae bacterium]
GSGGGIGRGIGPGTEFFGAREHGHSFAYVIDCSGSMGLRNSLEVAKHELLASLNQLPPDARFSVIFYNLRARVFADPSGQQGLMPATTGNKVRVQGQLQTVAPDGGTDHMVALRTALGLKPEVIFFLTDADLMTNNDVNAILAEAQGSRIQAVEFGRGTDLGMQTPLRRLATTTGGTYRYIDVTGFPRSASGY